jgi:hypothetical protein
MLPEDKMMSSRVRVHRKIGTAYEVKYSPLHDEFVKGLHHLFNTCVVIPKVNVQKIDVVRSKVLEGFFDGNVKRF